ncbi:unnamed protein product [Peronospora belbahrii]|uniref:Endonuclease/exonuclease/phosphatase domain-containing protein n=1 Tax=Peronospora belbahrii TaxID=622444 RepID=A0AAU9KPL7_9STRA|nr:unnamed protein product [Peronospora belbahrii]
MLFRQTNITFLQQTLGHNAFGRTPLRLLSRDAMVLALFSLPLRLFKTSATSRLMSAPSRSSTDELSERSEYFRTLPTEFLDTVPDRAVRHLVVGDFNVTLDSYLDQKVPSLHHLGSGREDLCAWMDTLDLMDSWRHMHPDTRDFTSPTRKNRLDCCLLTADFVQDHLVDVCHVRDRQWHTEDHIPVEFRLQARP